MIDRKFNRFYSLMLTFDNYFVILASAKKALRDREIYFVKTRCNVRQKYYIETLFS